MNAPSSRADSDEVRDVWNANASYWDAQMGEGNAWVNQLIWPATEQLLEFEPGARVLDVACGNGLCSRRLAARGAKVVAFDIADELIRRARERTAGKPYSDKIEYHTLDAADESTVKQFGAASFDAALCQMALFDMPEIDPLLRALAVLLRPGGTFVFSVMHPCFNSARFAHLAEALEIDGRMTTQYSLKLYEYITPRTYRVEAIAGQPRLQPIFHRPLQVLLNSCFAAGFVLDALREPAFPPLETTAPRQLNWREALTEFPPVLVARVRLRS